MIKELTAITPEYLKHRLEEQEECYKQEIERLNKNKKEALEFIERYLQLNLEEFNASSLLRKIREILDKTN